MTIRTRILLHAALLLGAGAGLSGCVYDLGLGFASDGYYDEYDDGYGCDPYGGYNAYYDCDYGQGFGNIGFGGGWYENYYYPGYGIFLFDNGGRRYPMRERYRRYWGEKRHSWYREHRSDRREGSRKGGRERAYNDNIPPGAGRGRDHNDGERDGRRGWRRDPNSPPHEEGSHPKSAPLPNLDIMQGQESDRGREEGYGRRDRRGGEAADASPPSPSRVQLPSQEQNAPLVSQAPEPRIEPIRPQPSPQRGSERGIERPD